MHPFLSFYSILHSVNAILASSVKFVSNMEFPPPPPPPSPSVEGSPTLISTYVTCFCVALEAPKNMVAYPRRASPPFKSPEPLRLSTKGLLLRMQKY